ncbi:EF-P lysine aminoacylase GenX [Patescibacteria group bacterium]|nr:EF-P lysine aminoacylase GenX [Patescibacteria group bacterium]
MKKRSIQHTRQSKKEKTVAVPIATPSLPSRVHRTHRIADLARAIGKTVTVTGRVFSVGDDSFILRDETGATQIFSPELPVAFAIIEITGVVEKDAVGKNAVVHLRATGGRELVPADVEPTRRLQWERMLLDPAGREIIRQRGQYLAAIRAFFLKRGFLEADTPSLVAVPGAEPYLSPLETTVTTADGERAPGFLATSPEYCLKKLLVAGFEKLFEFSRSFRNEENLGGMHNHEFLMLEWYRAYASYLEIMDDCEALVRTLAKEMLGSQTLRVRGTTVHVDHPWERISVVDAFQKYAAVDLEKNLDVESLRRTVRAKGYRPTDAEAYDDLFFRIFLNEIEPCLGRKVPTILYDYPVQMGALAKRSERDPRFAERFELYIAGVELANAYTELNDAVEQEERLRADIRLRKKMGKTAIGPDEDFMHALRIGMPPSGGIALGLDRLLMLLLGKERIEDVRLFPASELFVFQKKGGKKKGS